MRVGERSLHIVATIGIVLTLILPASATFPGKNGRIAFVVGPDIYTMNPDGSDVRQLTNLGPDGGAFWESWSADGKQIVFNEYRPPDYMGQLWLMNADGSNQRLLLADTDFDDERPSFTPDGNFVVFSRCRPPDLETCALFQIEINGSGITQITDFKLGIRDVSPQYSFDDRLAFTGTSRQGIICAIELMDAKQLALRRLTPAPLAPRQPDWSPDGTRIAFSTHCRGGTENFQNEEIWMVDTKGNGLRRLTTNGNEYFSGPHDFHPSWSPQGDAIVFERDTPDYSSSGIFIMKSDGSGCSKVFALGSSAHRNKLQLRRNQALDSRAARRLKQIEDGGAMPQWGPAAD